MKHVPIKRAIISVADKSGIGEFARQLKARAWKSSPPAVL